MTLSAEQLRVRRDGIGSSEIAALVDLDPRQTKLDVYVAKVYGSRRRPDEEMEFGDDVEPAIVSYRVRRLGASLYREADYRRDFGDRILAFDERKCSATIRSAESPIAITTPDALVLLPEIEDDPARRKVIEAKHVGWYNSGEWGEADEDAPINFWLQCQWHMGVTGVTDAEIAASIGGLPPSDWTVGPHRATYENLVVVAERFWRDHVEKRVPPVDKLDASESAAEYLRAAFPKETEPVLPKAPPELEELALHYAQTARELTAKEAEKEALRNQICAFLGLRAGAVLSDGRRVTWLWQRNGPKKPPTRVLRVPKEKEK